VLDGSFAEDLRHVVVPQGIRSPTASEPGKYVRANDSDTTMGITRVRVLIKELLIR